MDTTYRKERKGNTMTDKELETIRLEMQLPSLPAWVRKDVNDLITEIQRLRTANEQLRKELRKKPPGFCVYCGQARGMADIV